MTLEEFISEFAKPGSVVLQGSKYNPGYGESLQERNRPALDKRARLE